MSDQIVFSSAVDLAARIRNKDLSAREVMEAGGLCGAAFNAAKEAALDAFIAGRIGFTVMAEVVETVLERLSASGDLGNAPGNLDMVLEADRAARRVAADVMTARQGS